MRAHKAVLRLRPCPRQHLAQRARLPCNRNLAQRIRTSDEADDDNITWNCLRGHLSGLQGQLNDHEFADWNLAQMRFADCFTKSEPNRPLVARRIPGRRGRLANSKTIASFIRLSVDSGFGNTTEETDKDDSINSLSVWRKVGSLASLTDHTRHVVEWARRFANAANASADLRRSIERAALLHDLGKLDPRWQAYLRGVARWSSLASEPLAIEPAFRCLASTSRNDAAELREMPQWIPP